LHENLNTSIFRFPHYTSDLFLVVGLVGLIKTLTYKPNLSINQNSVSLQNNVSFGSIDGSNPYPYSFIGAIIIFFLLLRFVYGVKKAA
jgi:hypothetical protein